MSEEQLKAFIAKAKDDQTIQEKLKAAKTAEDVIGIAKEHGDEFTTEHMTQLSEEELEGVAGGAGGLWPPSALTCIDGVPPGGSNDCGDWVID